MGLDLVKRVFSFGRRKPKEEAAPEAPPENEAAPGIVSEDAAPVAGPVEAPVEIPEPAPEPAPDPALTEGQADTPPEPAAPAETGPVALAPAEPAEIVEPPQPAAPPPTRPEPDKPDPVKVEPAPSNVVQGEPFAITPVKVQAPAPIAEPESADSGWYGRLKKGLTRSSDRLTDNFTGLFTKRRLDYDTLEELEDALIAADLGTGTATRIISALSKGRYGKNITDSEVRAVMAEEIEAVLSPVARPLALDLSHKPHVILVVGVNGTGKTTTIGKLAAKLTANGLDVTLAAGDTFRAAAVEQLAIWASRTGAHFVSSTIGADAAGLAYEAFEKARASGSQVLIIDTAGRLQNRAELMAELEKIVRVLRKHDPEAPHTVLQTLDATTGQNALSQVKIFAETAGVNGLVMTKLDGTARGGILVAIAEAHRLPVYFVGVGEEVEDLEPFEAGEFARAIAGVA